MARTRTYRDLADYERSWSATPRVVEAAFAEIEPLIRKAEQLLERNA